MKVYVLLARGFGDSEDEFNVLSVHSSQAKADAAKTKHKEEMQALFEQDGPEDADYEIEEHEVD